MAIRTPAQAIEVFHLLFLRVLAATRQDWFVLKGGANIRYFFESPRYSNDIDLDFSGREAWKVGQTVEKVLAGRALRMLLEQARLQIAETSAPKQTETTRRWKIGIVAEGHSDPIRTKIEFSDRNGGSDDVAVDVVPEGIVLPYGIMAPTLVHYEETAAIEQKIAALALRSETKARDVFDLDLLLRRRGVATPPRRRIATPYANEAALRTSEIAYESFRTEVIPFLDAELAVLYDRLVWEQMRAGVATSLERIGNPTGGAR